MRYEADDEPLLPQIPKKHLSAVTSKMPSGDTSEPVIMRPAKSGARIGRGQAFGLAALGMAALILGVFVSSALSLEVTIEAGNAANVRYGIDWWHLASFVKVVK